MKQTKIYELNINIKYMYTTQIQKFNSICENK